MTKTARNTAAAAEEAFHRHYAAIWGQERWHNLLYPALAEPTRYAALLNRYAPTSKFWHAMDEAQIDREALRLLRLPQLARARSAGSNDIFCFEQVSAVGSAFPPPKQTSSSARLLTHWNLDAASALVASMLGAIPGDRVLDLCAAPGGKSIALAQSLFPEHHQESDGLQPDDQKLCNDAGNSNGDIGPTTGAGRQTIDNSATSRPTVTPPSVLRTNEADPRRQKRLSENLQAYLPPQLIKQGNIQCLRIDGTQPATNAILISGGYDKILVDAPCSSERHIIHAHLKARASGNAALEMTSWRPGASKRLAQTQLALLMTALKAVRVGGRVVYATCSIDTAENDGVVEKMLGQVEKERRKGGRWGVRVGFEGEVDGGRVESEMEGWAERTKCGWIVLPDHAGGGHWGPLFFAVLTKVAET